MTAPWHHPGITKDQAEGLLVAAGMQTGSFLVRDSEKREGAYALCIWDEGRVRQYRILPTGNGYLQIQGHANRQYPSLMDLMESYRTDPQGLACPLLYPVKTGQEASRPAGRSPNPVIKQPPNIRKGDDDSTMYFPIIIIPTRGSEQCGLEGRFVLKVSAIGLSLLDPSTDHVLYLWPFRHIRRYGRNAGAFLFECGRKCGSGEGDFAFRTPCPNDVFHAADNLRKKVFLMRTTVTVSPTEAAKRCKLKGEYTLQVCSEGIVLLNCVTEQLLYDWPYIMIRRYGRSKTDFTIEAGSRCASGEGTFTFKSSVPEEIFQHVDHVRAHLSRARGNEATTHAPKARSNEYVDVPGITYAELASFGSQPRAVGASRTQGLSYADQPTEYSTIVFD
ncbi:PREDICTED: uncharacterized protein LOC109474026 [Branchiostoma belcheri]|uniref:Uncharacterized protein LOC109474026 n=1 Tax=Branchiostoma belcheri TaxID=7741 RepID=A0A6P4ZJK3_BRABE|nr:PREDICTED: uncharacterized protein LOC109474026 [Branchiostoma belcheri]